MKSFSKEVNTSEMSTEELKELREKLQNMLSVIEHQLKTRAILNQKHHAKWNKKVDYFPLCKKRVSFFKRKISKKPFRYRIINISKNLYIFWPNIFTKHKSYYNISMKPYGATKTHIYAN